MCTTSSGTVTQNQSAFGMGAQLTGGIISSIAGQSYHNANASYLNSMANTTQVMADKAIDSVQYAGGMAASQTRNKGKALTDTQKTVMAAKGLSSGSFTYQNILDDTIAKSEMDALAIQYNADVQSQNIRNQANFQIANYKSQAAVEQSAGNTSLLSGLLSTGTQFADTYNKWMSTSQGKTNAANNGNTTYPYNTNFYTGVKSIDNANLDKYADFSSIYSNDSSMPTWKKLSYMQGGKLW